MNLAAITARLAGRTPGIQGVNRQYAVLVPLVEEAGELRLLFEVRASTMSRPPVPCGRRQRSWPSPRRRWSCWPPWTCWSSRGSL